MTIECARWHAEWYLVGIGSVLGCGGRAPGANVDLAEASLAQFAIKDVQR